jgi:hypothetical protein
LSFAPKEGVFDFGGVKIVAKLLNASFNSDALETRNLDSGSVWVDWSAASAADATAKIQEAPTADGPWQDRTGASITIDAAGPASKKIAVSNVDSPWMRVAVTKNSETTALVTLRHYLKGAR